MRKFIIYNPMVPMICGLTSGLLLTKIIGGVNIQLTIIFSLIILMLMTIVGYRIREILKINKKKKEINKRVEEFVNKHRK